MSKTEKASQIRKFTTGQVSGIASVGHQSLRNYVKQFPEFFSDTAKQHKQGRRWSLDDVAMVRGIAALYHERTGTAKIRELLAGGWRLYDNEAWVKELQSKLIEMTLMAYADSEEISRQAVAAIDDLQGKSGMAEWNVKAFQALWITVHDLVEEVKAIKQVEGITGKVELKLGRRWHGNPPDLYQIVPLHGTPKDYKFTDV